VNRKSKTSRPNRQSVKRKSSPLFGADDAETKRKPSEICPIELRPNIDVPDLENILQEVIETLSTRERQVRDREGCEYLLRVRPYRTTDNKIDGAVLALIDMDGNSDRGSSNNRKRGARGKAGVTNE